MPYFGVPIRNGISPGLGSAIGFGSRNPIQAVITALFGSGEQGIAVPDLTPNNGYLFQDSATPTTPVTAFEQKVGYILDRSGRGNHIRTTNSTSAPTLSARYNILNATATLATQTATTRAGGYTINLSGSGSVTLSGTATGTFSAGINTFTATAGTLTVTVTGTVTNADIRLTIDTVGQPAYQDIRSSTDYDTNGFYPYLSFGGTQSMYTAATVDFSATAQMNCFAGLTSLLSSTQVIYELSADWNSNNGSFDLERYSDDKFYVSSRGTTSRQISTSAIPSPASKVLTTQYDISAPYIKVNVNGALDVSNTATQGTGNYGNYGFYLGARNKTSYYFTGRLYPFFICGASKSAGVIAQVEQFIKARMPVSF